MFLCHLLVVLFSNEFFSAIFIYDGRILYSVMAGKEKKMKSGITASENFHLPEMDERMIYSSDLKTGIKDANSMKDILEKKMRLRNTVFEAGSLFKKVKIE